MVGEKPFAPDPETTKHGPGREFVWARICLLPDGVPRTSSDKPHVIPWYRIMRSRLIPTLLHVVEILKFTSARIKSFSNGRFHVVDSMLRIRYFTFYFRYRRLTIRGNPDGRCAAGLPPLDDAKNPDPGSRLRGLTREGCSPGVLPRHRGGLRSVHLDHIVDKCVIVDFVDHAHHPVECVVPGAGRKSGAGH